MAKFDSIARRAAFGALVALASAAGCLVSETDSCLRHSDCPLDQSCSAGRCVVPSKTSTVDAGADASDASSDREADVSGDGSPDASEAGDGSTDGEAADGEETGGADALADGAEAGETGADAGEPSGDAATD